MTRKTIIFDDKECYVFDVGSIDIDDLEPIIELPTPPPPIIPPLLTPITPPDPGYYKFPVLDCTPEVFYDMPAECLTYDDTNTPLKNYKLSTTLYMIAAVVYPCGVDPKRIATDFVPPTTLQITSNVKIESDYTDPITQQTTVPAEAWDYYPIDDNYTLAFNIDLPAAWENPITGEWSINVQPGSIVNVHAVGGGRTGTAKYEVKTQCDTCGVSEYADADYECVPLMGVNEETGIGTAVVNLSAVNGRIKRAGPCPSGANGRTYIAFDPNDEVLKQDGVAASSVEAYATIGDTKHNLAAQIMYGGAFNITGNIPNSMAGDVLDVTLNQVISYTDPEKEDTRQTLGTFGPAIVTAFCECKSELVIEAEDCVELQNNGEDNFIELAVSMAMGTHASPCPTADLEKTRYAPSEGLTGDDKPPGCPDLPESFSELRIVCRAGVTWDLGAGEGVPVAITRDNWLEGSTTRTATVTSVQYGDSVALQHVSVGYGYAGNPCAVVEHRTVTAEHDIDIRFDCSECSPEMYFDIAAPECVEVSVPSEGRLQGELPFSAAAKVVNSCFRAHTSATTYLPTEAVYAHVPGSHMAPIEVGTWLSGQADDNIMFNVDGEFGDMLTLNVWEVSETSEILVTGTHEFLASDSCDDDDDFCEPEVFLDPELPDCVTFDDTANTGVLQFDPTPKDYDACSHTDPEIEIPVYVIGEEFSIHATVNPAREGFDWNPKIVPADTDPIIITFSNVEPEDKITVTIDGDVKINRPTGVETVAPLDIKTDICEVNYLWKFIDCAEEEPSFFVASAKKSDSDLLPYRERYVLYDFNGKVVWFLGRCWSVEYINDPEVEFTPIMLIDEDMVTNDELELIGDSCEECPVPVYELTPCPGQNPPALENLYITQDIVVEYDLKILASMQAVFEIDTVGTVVPRCYSISEYSEPEEPEEITLESMIFIEAVHTTCKDCVPTVYELVECPNQTGGSGDLYSIDDILEGYINKVANVGGLCYSVSKYDGSIEDLEIIEDILVTEGPQDTCDDCVPPIYTLTNCVEGTPTEVIYTESDLADYLAKIVNINGDPDNCYTVSLYYTQTPTPTEPPETIVDVVITGDYETCQQCLPVFLLTGCPGAFNCETGVAPAPPDTYANNLDLVAAVGLIVQIGADCYAVSRYTGGDVVAAEVVWMGPYGDCLECQGEAPEELDVIVGVTIEGTNLKFEMQRILVVNGQLRVCPADPEFITIEGTDCPVEE